MNSEPELSAEARRVIAAAKGSDDPSSDDRERVKARWLATVATAASVSTLAEVARAASSSGWGTKALAWVLALAAGTAGIIALLPEEPSPVPASSAQRSGGARREVPAPIPEPVVAAPVAAEVGPEQPVSAPEPEPRMPQPEQKPEAIEPVVRTPARTVAVRRPSPVVQAPPEPAAAAPAPEAASVVAAGPEVAPSESIEQVQATPVVDSAVESRQLGEETLVLSKIRRSLRDGAAARALEGLAEYRQRFEKPLLGMEAAALRVDALCRSGDVVSGRAEAEIFHATWPSSPLEQRVRAACP